MNFNWSASNYKVVALMHTLLMTGHKHIQNQTWDGSECKKIWNICFPEKKIP
jgi:hypothetical protein